MQIIILGFPEDKVKEYENVKGIHEFTHIGNKILMDIHVEPKYHSEFILGQEVEEKINADLTIKTAAHLEGNTLTLKSKLPNGKTETKIHTFSDSGLTVVFQDEDPATPDAVRVFRRL
ncbi:hypothetical protein WA026_007481 [Henosepilachna vigintioctopunctata]|uniref:Uncharacterized protein n=1 Tax=Henosepilachna vigintioctopunctata TaxID=420089 RepID=A0AAW1UV15_9CUCU